MHKDQAAQLFGALSEPTRVKCMKLLYHNGEMDREKLALCNGVDEEKIKAETAVLADAGLIFVNGNVCRCNKQLLDELTSFIATPCGCVRLD